MFFSLSLKDFFLFIQLGLANFFDRSSRVSHFAEGLRRGALRPASAHRAPRPGLRRTHLPWSQVRGWEHAGTRSDAHPGGGRARGPPQPACARGRAGRQLGGSPTSVPGEGRAQPAVPGGLRLLRAAHDAAVSAGPAPRPLSGSGTAAACRGGARRGDPPGRCGAPGSPWRRGRAQVRLRGEPGAVGSGRSPAGGGAAEEGGTPATPKAGSIPPGDTQARLL